VRTRLGGKSLESSGLDQGTLEDISSLLTQADEVKFSAASVPNIDPEHRVRILNALSQLDEKLD